MAPTPLHVLPTRRCNVVAPWDSIRAAQPEKAAQLITWSSIASRVARLSLRGLSVWTFSTSVARGIEMRYARPPA